MRGQASYHCDWLELNLVEKHWEASELSQVSRELGYLCTNTQESQFEGFWGENVISQSLLSFQVFRNSPQTRSSIHW